MRLESVAEYLRLSHVKRWSIVKTADTQTVAEHSWRVCAIFVKWAPLIGLAEQEIADGLMYGLFHDVHEVRTGDMPTPTKSPELKALLTSYEEQIAPEVTEMERKLTLKAKDLLRFADTVEAILYLRVNGLGKHSQDVCKLLEEQALSRLERSKIEPAAQRQLIAVFTSTYHLT